MGDISESSIPSRDSTQYEERLNISLNTGHFSCIHCVIFYYF